MARYLEENNTKRYYRVLQQLVAGLNSRSLKTLKGLSPDRIDSSNQQEIFEFKFGDLLKKKRGKAGLKIGDKVRLRLFKVFKRSSSPSFTKEIFEVSKLSYAAPVWLYHIRDLDGLDVRGRYYLEDLSPVEM